MSEAKRVTLTTISSTATSSLTTAGSSNTLRFDADFLVPATKTTSAASSSSSGNKSTLKAIRLNVELFQTDSNKYPEFNYAKLLHLEKKKIKKIKQKSNGFSDPFGENDDELERIAKEFEKKYGNTYSSGRGKNKRDNIDIGMGYDESDSFIDNTEAYDELISDDVETIKGGFYINCGPLEFTNLYKESMTTKTDEIIKMPNRPKKRVISSSSEESSSSGDDDDDSNEDDDDDESGEESTSVETTKSKSSATATTDNKKPKPSSSAITSNPAKKKATSLQNGVVTSVPAKKSNEKNLTSGISLSASNSPKPIPEDVASDAEKNIKKKLEKTTTVKDMLKAQRDNFLKSQTSNGDVKDKSSAEDDDDDSSSSDSDDEDDSDDNSDSNQTAPQTQKDKKSASGNEDNSASEKLRTADTNLPDLDADLLVSIREFKDSVKSLNMIGKKFQFDDKLSESFLKIDDSLLCLDKVQRNVVFAHLEYQLSLPKYYFLRKVKQLRIKEEKLKSKRAFNKLHKAITETMPAVVASYDAELKRFAELQAANINSDQPPKMPKKKFPWNANIRNLLYDVYQVRWTTYPVLGTRKETLEEFITSYMRDKVVEIWPKGWIRYEELKKEIEKRKIAAKKAKEKKKLSSAIASGQSSPNPNVTANPTASIQISSVSSLATGAPTTSSAQQTASFIKQFEDFATRSNANSDTESIASSNTSSGLKRKTTDAGRKKPTKAKAAKLNGEQTKTSNKNNNPPKISVDLMSPTKRTDHSINHIMSPTGGTTVPIISTSTSIFSATTAAASQPLSKHSSNTHVIDLDNYKCVGDILQTSKKLQAAAAASSSLLSATNVSSVSRRESSGDSEIEFIGVFPNKNQNKKIKTESRSTTPNSNYPGNEKSSSSSHHHYNNNNNNNKNSNNNKKNNNNKTESRSTTPNSNYPGNEKSSSSSHHHYNNNNNNNKNSNNNRKKAANSGLTNLPGMDVNKMVSALMELGDEQQNKPSLLSTAQQKNSQTSTMSQSGSHQ